MSEDAQVAVVAPGGRMASREVRYYRVRVRSSEGWSPWSDALRQEAGLLEASDWIGEAITLPDDPGDDSPVARAAPSPCIRGRRPGPTRPVCTSPRWACTG